MLTQCAQGLILCKNPRVGKNREAGKHNCAAKTMRKTFYIFKANMHFES